MELQGIIVKKLEKINGKSQNGEWQKQEFIISVGDKYPKNVCLSAWGERCDELENIQIGDTVTAELEISSREYNGKWYTEVKAWKFLGLESNQAPKVQESTQPVQSNSYPKEEAEGDLPF
jgi:hypothetical protein